MPGADLDTLVNLAVAASKNRRGAMLIISGRAKAEAGRFTPQATRMTPDQLAPQTLKQLTGMDGGMLVDPEGRCHAIGVILDGTASQNGDPSRRSRYNNAVRYIDGDSPPVVVLCYSFDGRISILPALRPRRRRSEVEALVQRFVTACSVSPPQQQVAADAAERIADVRFYLSAAQCGQINQARADLNAWRLRGADLPAACAPGTA